MFAYTHAIQLTLGDTTLPSTVPSSPVVYAVEWLAVCALCALIYYGLALLVFRRRHRKIATHRETLFVSFFLVAFAGSNLALADTVAPHELPFFLPIPGLFLLFFYLFSDGRYARTWTRWLVLLYGLSQLGPLGPPTAGQTNPNPEFDQFISHAPGGLLAALQVVGMVGNILAVTAIVIGIVPQIYYRYRHLCETGAQYQIQRNTKVILGAAICAGSFLVLLASVLLAQPSSPALSPLFRSARTGFYLLTTLIPVAIGFALLRGKRYDREAFANRVLIYGTLTICLLLIYIATTGLRFFLPDLLTYPLILVFILLVMPFMAALFRPLRAQIQDRVDRRFFRRRYEAARLLAASRATLRNEIHLDQLSKQLVTVLQKAWQPDSVTLWLAGAPGRMTPLSANAGSALVAASTHELILRREAGVGSAPQTPVTLAIGSGDPFRASLLRPSSVVDIGRLLPDSAAATALQAEGIQTALPLVSRDGLVGMFAIKPQPGAPAYSVDEGDLLTTFTDSVAPVLHVVKSAHEQDVVARERERVEQELHTARRIQESLLPKVVPTLDGWQLATLYQPAREVGGDFYDFISLPDGRLGLVLGDVTDKGIPAALVMATTRSMLRAVGTQHSFSPGQVLAQVNELLYADLPASMFVTCFYAILDPATGKLQYANAGQDLPYVRHTNGEVCEVRATGMPLGLMPGSVYDEQERILLPGDSLLLYSDGLVEAHNPEREMFGFPRLMRLLGEHGDGTPPIMFLLHELTDFTGAAWEQEDDITLVALQRAEGDGLKMDSDASATPTRHPADGTAWRVLDEWTVASVPGNERQAIQRVTEAVKALGMRPQALEQLQTAVGEATMNAMEHGNSFDPNLSVAIQVLASATRMSVRITDEGGHVALPEAEAPDLQAKLAGLQSPRGWGLFLIENLVDEVHITGDETHRTVELIVALQGEPS